MIFILSNRILPSWYPPGWKDSLQTLSAMAYLEQFFSDNVLLLDEIDTSKITYDNLPDKLHQIKQTVDNNNIQTIVINDSLNPKILNSSYYLPNSLELLDKLSSIANVYILTGDFSYYYKPQPNIIFFPVFLWLTSTKSIDEYFGYTTTVYDADIKKNHAIMCLNNNLTWHRMYLFSLIVEKTWFKKIDYSFLKKPSEQFEKSGSIKNFLTPEDYNIIKTHLHLFPIQIEQEKINPDIVSRTWCDGFSIDSEIYNQCAINLVTETSLTEGILLTEKISKCFMAYQIPILIGPMGANQFLEDIGLDMFGDYVLWKSWDSESNHKIKIQKIVNFLEDLLHNDNALQNILLTYQSFHTRVIKNKQYFHSKEFQNILLKQLRF